MYKVPTVNFWTSNSQTTLNNIVNNPIQQIQKNYSKQEFFDDIDKIKQAKWLDDMSAYYQVANYYKQKWYSVQGIDLDSDISDLSTRMQDQKSQEEDKWFFEALWNVIKERWNKWAQILSAWVQKKQWTLESWVQYATNLLGWLADVVWTWIMEWLDTVTPEVVQDKLKEWIKTAMDTKWWQWVWQKLAEAQKNFEDLQKYNPRVARNFQAIADTINTWLTFVWWWATWKAVKSWALKTAWETALNVWEKALQTTWKAVKWIWKLWQETTWFAVAQVSWLNPQTLKTIFKNPEVLTSWITKESNATKILNALDTRLEDLSLTGKGYQDLITWKVVSNWDELMNKINTTLWNINEKTLTKADKNLLDDAKSYIERYTWDITDTELHSLRQQIDSIKYDPTTWLKRKLTPTWNKILTSLRSEIDSLAWEKISWLKELDLAYWTEKKTLQDVRNMLFKSTWELKDNYLSTLSNLTNQNNVLKLEKIKKIVPNIEEDINALKALEDVEFAKWQKVATYARSVVWWWWLVAWVTWTINPLLWVAMFMITNPTIVANAVKIAWYSAKFIERIMTKIKKWIKLSLNESKAVWKAIQSQLQETKFTKDINPINKKWFIELNPKLPKWNWIDYWKIEQYYKNKLWTDDVSEIMQKVKRQNIETQQNIMKKAISEKKNINKTNNDFYWMEHRPTENWATADNISKNWVIPEDIYTNPEYYFNPNDTTYKESFSVLKKIKWNPNEEVTIYRAWVKDEFNRWDWITLSKTYAKEHMERFWSKWVFSKKVKAKDIQFAWDDINEFWYFPKQNPINKKWFIKLNPKLPKKVDNETIFLKMKNENIIPFDITENWRSKFNKYDIDLSKYKEWDIIPYRKVIKWNVIPNFMKKNNIDFMYTDIPNKVWLIKDWYIYIQWKYWNWVYDWLNNYIEKKYWLSIDEYFLYRKQYNQNKIIEWKLLKKEIRENNLWDLLDFIQTKSDNAKKSWLSINKLEDIINNYERKWYYWKDYDKYKKYLNSSKFEYWQKSNNIWNAINLAKKENIKTILWLDEKKIPVIYFELPNWQASFHLPNIDPIKYSEQYWIEYKPSYKWSWKKNTPEIIQKYKQIYEQAHKK